MAYWRFPPERKGVLTRALDAGADQFLPIVQRLRRSVIARCAVPRATAVGERRGRELRSRSPGSPSTRYRPTHLPTVLRSVRQRSATEAIRSPANTA